MIAELFRFRGGIKPDSRKEDSTREPIARAPIPPRLIVPLRQSPTRALPLVEPGDRVLKGERIGAADGAFGAAVHAPTSGTVTAIEPLAIPHPSGLPSRCAVIEPDGEDRWMERTPVDPLASDPGMLRDRLRDAGVVGLGGAAFPSHAKLRAASLDTVILNGAECEPWITCDDMLMRERAAGILRGAQIIRHIVGAKRVLIGIEDNKPLALGAMRAALDAGVSGEMKIVPVPTLYPAGGEKQLIRVLTGIEIPYGKLGPDFGVQCFNVGTAHAVHRALDHGEPLISRVVTITGNVARPRNFDALIGTPIDVLLALAGPRPDTDRYIAGGPMMGFGLPSTAVPVVKATNCVIAASPKLFPPPPPEMPCIRCGRCAQVCPAELQPFELYWFARSHNYGKCQEYGVFDCIECGCCSYVCPSSIRLVDYYRFAKAEIRSREREKQAADAARERFEFRQHRLEREKQEKAERLAAKAAATRQAAAGRKEEKAKPPPAPEPSSTPAPEAMREHARPTEAPSAAPAAAAAEKPAVSRDPKRALIEAAMERARQQKAAIQPRNTENLTAEQRAEIAEVEARRSKVREMARTPETPED